MVGLVPVLPSLPGAVQVRVIELEVGLVAVRLVTAAGGVLSGCAITGTGSNPNKNMVVIERRRTWSNKW